MASTDPNSDEDLRSPALLSSTMRLNFYSFILVPLSLVALELNRDHVLRMPEYFETVFLVFKVYSNSSIST
jgi:hypothetical protein